MLLSYSSKQWPTEETQLPATLESLDALHAAVERFWRVCDAAPQPPCAGSWRRGFDTAVGEIGGNIVRHACAGLPVAQVRLRLRLRPSAVVACFVDTGRAYAAMLPVAPIIHSHDLLELPESGMGLPIAQAALDRLHYRRARGVNIWYLLKTLPPPP
jgi:anti-sigma regulatory factor (Ser/Thr protein kinase)